MSDTFDRLKAALADRYALEREIGAGGMATVYLAEDLKHHRKVAVKVLRPDLAAALGPERFLREIEIAANLTHPHIVPLYDSGEAEGFLYYVLPYIEGESLRAKLAREGELPITDAVRILRDVVDALTDAHAHGIVHRDIKPDNVLLTKHHAVVTDFGVAKAVSEATGREKLTTAGVALGTPAYMAPEQAVADPHVDHRADIYAVGAVAYELLTGRPPFTGTTPQMVLSAHVTEVPEPVNKDRQAVPPALAQLVMKCLEKKPADRWQSAEELLPQLEALATPSGGITPTGTLPVEAVPGAAHKRPRYLIPVATVAVATVIGAAAWLALGLGDRERGQATAVSRQSVAVLPFTSVRSDEESQAFTTGIHGDILTQLSKIGALKVISRTSVLEYENTTKNIRQIGEELGVATVLEGAVQRAGNQLRINLQLFDAQSDEPLWAETYNREWTVDNLFAIQSDVAQRVAAALQATLSAEERARIGSRPTGNLEAYEAYQRGNEYEGRSAREQDIRLAIRHYEQAVQLDGNFALAHARLSRVHSKMWWYFYDRDEARLALAKQAVDRALALDPDLPEAHMALGYYYYWGFLEFDRALAEFAITERAQPNNALLFNGIGSVHRRRGEMEKALRYYQRQLDLSPRSLGAASAVAETHALLRNSAEAQRYYDMVIALRPELAGSYSDKAASYLRLDGDPQRARDVLDRADVLGLSRPGFSNVEFRLDVVEGNYQAALGRLPAASTDIVLDEPYFYVPAALRYAQLYAFMGNRELTRAYYDTARVVLERVVRERPDDARLHMTLGFVYGGLGRKADAIREGKRGVELRPVEKDALLGASAIEELARIYALVGEVDAAVEQLELLFSIPWDIDIPYLKIDPTWAPLTDHPGFRRLLASEN